MQIEQTTKDECSKIEELSRIFIELEARYTTGSLVIPEYQSTSWVALCNKGIDLLETIREE